MKIKKIQIAKNTRHGEYNIIINEKYAYIFAFFDPEQAIKKANQFGKEIGDKVIYKVEDIHKRDLEII